MHRTAFFIVLCAGSAGLALGLQSTTALSSDQAPPHIQQRIAAYTRSIDILETGLKQNWSQDRYQIAFEHLQKNGSASEDFMACQDLLAPLVSPRAIWDERLPFNAEVRQALERCREKRDLLVEATKAFKTTQSR